MNPELRSCPFCGSPAQVTQTITFPGTEQEALVIVGCSNAGCPLSHDMMHVDGWNKRPLEDALLDRITKHLVWMAEQGKAISKLRDEIADFTESYRRVMAEECAPDEKHCACVPALRLVIDALRQQIAAKDDRIAMLETLVASQAATK